MKLPYGTALMSAAIMSCVGGGGVCQAQLPATAPRSGVWSPDNAIQAATAVGTTLYVGGLFKQIGPLTGGFALVDPGTAEIAATTPFVDGIVHASTPDGAGGWYFTGNFARVGGAVRGSMARIRANGTLDSWAPAGGGENYAIAKVGNTIYLGGSGLWAFDASTGAPVPVNFALAGTVFALVVDGGTLYIGGGFTGLLGQSRSALAAIDIATNSLSPWNPGVSGNVTAMAAADGLIYVGGSFSAAGGQSRQNCAAIDVVTALASPFDPAPNGSVYAMTLDGPTLYIGGRFTATLGQPRGRLAALDRPSGALLPWNPTADDSPSLPSVPEVDALAVSGQNVLVGGTFHRINGESCPGVGAVDALSGATVAWNPRPAHESDPIVGVISPGPQGVMIGGRISVTGGEYREGLAAYDLSTWALLPWHPGLSAPSGQLTQICAMASGANRVFASGVYTPTPGGSVMTPLLVAIDPGSGVVDPNFAPFSIQVLHSMAVAGNVLCLPCTGPGGVASLCGMNAATGDLLWWNPASGGDAVVAFGPATNELVAAVNGSVRAYNPITGAPAPWLASISNVLAMRFLGTRLFVAGGFNAVAGVARYGLAAIDFPTPDAPVLAAWAPVSTSNATVSSLATQGQAVYAMGGFQNIGGAFRPLVAGVNWQAPAACAWSPPRPAVAGSILAATDSALVLTGYRSVDNTVSLPRLAVFDMRSCRADFSGDCLLNVNDFSAFLNAYAAGSPEANCDGSTIPPVLNVNDFACFLNAYAIGCP